MGDEPHVTEARLKEIAEKKDRFSDTEVKHIGECGECGELLAKVLTRYIAR